MNETYEPNSHKYKERRLAEERERVITKPDISPVKVKKKSGVGKIISSIISDDADSIGSYAVSDVLIPAIKKAISDIVTNGIDILLYGESGRRARRDNISSSYVSYRGYSDNTSSDRNRDRDAGSPTRFDYDRIVFNSRSDAIATLDNLCSVISQYGYVTVADLYDMVEMDHPHTAVKYGWTNLNTARVEGVRDGYVLRLPKAMTID